MTTKIPVELSSTPGIADSSNATAITISSAEKVTFAKDIEIQGDSVSGSEGGHITLRAASGGSKEFGIDVDSSNNLRFITEDDGTGDNGAAHVYLSNTGNVGIGTSSPAAALDIATAGSTARPLAIRITNAAATNYAWEIWRDNTTGHLRFGHENAGTDSNRVSFLADGGITFNDDVAAANALDDYEEGTFDANLEDSGGGATLTLNSSYNALAYTKIGRQVHIQGVLVVSGVSGTANGTLQINNLPFASAGLVDQAGKAGGCGVSIYQVQKYSSGAFPVTSLAESSTTLQIQLGVVDANTYACYANTATQLYFSFTYITAT